MNSYFFLSGINDHRNGTAYLKGDPWSISDLLTQAQSIDTWTPVVFNVQVGQLCDYQPNDVVGCRLVSDRLKGVLEESKGKADVLQWLPANVTDAKGHAWPYWVLHFPGNFDVLNKTKTTFIRGTDHVIKPCLDRNLIENHRVFTYPNSTLVLIVSRDVKQTTNKVGCTGLEFSEALTA